MKIRVLIAATVLSTGLVACGGDDGEAAAPPTTTPPTTTPPAAANNSFNTFVVNAINQGPVVADSSEPTVIEGVQCTFNDEDATAFNSVLPP